MSGENHFNDVEEQVYHLVERRRFDQAEALIGTALRHNPENIALLYYSAFIYSEQKRYEDAESTLKDLLRHEPDHFGAGFLLAFIYKDLKQYAKAEGLVIELIRQNPESSASYTLYAEIMLETLYIEKAQNLAAEAVRMDPDDVSAQAVVLICNVIRGGKTDYHESLADLVRNYPYASTTSSMILLVLYEQKKYREALRLAKELLRCDPGNESLVEMIKELRILTHVTMIPLMPSIKYGWHASAVMYIIAIVAFYAALKYLPGGVASIVISGWLLYVLYSWFYPPILKRILG